MNLECQVCTGNKIATSFYSLDDLQAHLFSNHHNGPLDVFQFVCHKCEFKFGTEYRLLKHEEKCGMESRSEDDMEKIRYKLQMYELLEVTLKYNMTKHQTAGARPNPSLDNDTIVEVFKYLNYCQLAKTSLVSKRFSDLIRTHRHKLAILYVESIGMHKDNYNPAAIKNFDQELSLDAYNEWVIRNDYSKQIPLETQLARIQSTHCDRKVYRLHADADYHYTDSNPSFKEKSVFSASIDLSHENWPVFQHFIRLLTHPLIHIRSLGLPYQNDALNLLAGAINPDRGRLQCRLLGVSLQVNMQDRISWIKEHVFCYKIAITGSYRYETKNHDEELLDFFVTGANCTSGIYLKRYNPCKVIGDFVRKFMDLKGCDENKFVGSIECHPNATVNIDVLKRDYADFLVEGNINATSGVKWLVFDFVNNDIGKKLKLTIKIDSSFFEFLLRITNL